MTSTAASEIPAPYPPWVTSEQSCQRRLYGLEVLFAIYASKRPGNGHASLTTRMTLISAKDVTLAEVADQMRSAWLDIRFNFHPLVACTTTSPEDLLEADGYWLTYPKVDATGAEQWSRETVIVHERPMGQDELVASRQGPTATGTRPELHVCADTAYRTRAFHLVLLAGHWHTDARGAFRIFNRLVGHLNGFHPSTDRHWGEEVERLSVPLPIAAGLRRSEGGQIDAADLSEVKEFLQQWGAAKKSSEPHLWQKATDTGHGGPTLTSTITLSPSQTAALVEECRHHAVTVTSLLNVLVCVVFTRLFRPPGQPFPTGFVQLPAFSVSRDDSLLDPWKSSVGLQIGLEDLAFSTSEMEQCLAGGHGLDTGQVWITARKARQQLFAAKTAKDDITFDGEITAAIIPIVFSDDSQLLDEVLPFVSSVGRISDLLHTPPDAAWTVDSPVNTFVVNYPRPTVSFWEWGGQTVIHVSASAKFHLQDGLAAFVAELQGVLSHFIVNE